MVEWMFWWQVFVGVEDFVVEVVQQQGCGEQCGEVVVQQVEQVLGEQCVEVEDYYQLGWEQDYLLVVGLFVVYLVGDEEVVVVVGMVFVEYLFQWVFVVVEGFVDVVFVLVEE